MSDILRDALERIQKLAITDLSIGMSAPTEGDLLETIDTIRGLARYALNAPWRDVSREEVCIMCKRREAEATSCVMGGCPLGADL